MVALLIVIQKSYNQTLKIYTFDKIEINCISISLQKTKLNEKNCCFYTTINNWKSLIVDFVRIFCVLFQKKITSFAVYF